jgi:hypothetical protein
MDMGRFEFGLRVRVTERDLSRELGVERKIENKLQRRKNHCAAHIRIH